MDIKLFTPFTLWLTVFSVYFSCATANNDLLFEKQKPRTIPQLTIADTEHRSPLISLLSKNRITLLHFWATWCPSCVVELPKLVALNNKLSALNASVLTVSIDRKSPQYIREFLNQHHASSLDAYLADRKEAMQAYGLQGIPTSFLINKEKKIIYKIEGERDWSSPEILEKMKEIITAEKDSAS